MFSLFYFLQKHVAACVYSLTAWHEKFEIWSITHDTSPRRADFSYRKNVSMFRVALIDALIDHRRHTVDAQPEADTCDDDEERAYLI